MSDARLIVRGIETPLGTMGCGVVLRGEGAASAAVCLLEFEHRRALPRERRDLERHFGCAIEDEPAGRVPAADELIDRAREQLEAYFTGSLREFSLPLEMPGTEFQRRVWNALLEIPYGQTRSYGQLAAHLGTPGGARAVGMANGANRIAIVVPCHRVIESTGALRGYGGGIERKRFLLDLERGDTANGTLWESKPDGIAAVQRSGAVAMQHGARTQPHGVDASCATQETRASASLENAEASRAP